jgi:hypothetical protein
MINQLIVSYNNILKNDYIRIFIMLITGVFAGYTLQPVPLWLSKFFDTSNLLKFIVLFLGGSVAAYPLTNHNILIISICSIIILTIFHLFRTI